MNPGDTVRIEYIRPGKEITYYEDDFVFQDETCLRTFKTIPPDIADRRPAVRRGMSVPR